MKTSIAKKENEAPTSLRSGHLLPQLRRERNPSEAEISSQSAASLRSRFSAKGDITFETKLFNITLSKEYVYYLSVFTAVLAVIILWFRDGKFIASGESGLWLMAIKNGFEKSASVWSDFGTGYPTPALLPRIPTMYLLLTLQKFFAPTVTQGILFYFLIISGIIGAYRFSGILFDNKKVRALSGLFYFFNLFSMSQVWNRLAYTGIFTWSYLPWFILFFVKFVLSGKNRWLILFLIISVIYSYTFTTAAFIITLWIPASIWFAVLILRNFHARGKYTNITYIARGFVITILWLTVNLWWIFPYINNGAGQFTDAFPWKENFDILRGVTSVLPIWNYLLLYHSGYMSSGGPWGGWYGNLLPLILSTLILCVTLVGLYHTKKSKEKAFIILMVLSSLFIIKGDHKPFGYVFYEWLFKNIPLAGVMRNPYEKFGAVWVLMYSVLFSSGLIYLKNKLKHPISTVFIFLVLFLSMGLLVWPIWKGSVYTNNSKISVPSYYAEIEDFVSKKSDDGRILVTPMIPGDGAKYVWGYDGIEPSDFLFSRATISRIFRTKYPDNKYYGLLYDLRNKKDVSSYLEDFNIRYILVNHDIIPASAGTDNPEEISAYLKELNYAKYVGSFGNLELFENVNYSPDSLITSDSDAVVKYSKISNAHYKVLVDNKSGSFNFLFKSTYNPGWILKSSDREFNKHEVALGYANTWQVNQNGLYELDLLIEIWPWD